MFSSVYRTRNWVTTMANYENINWQSPNHTTTCSDYLHIFSEALWPTLMAFWRTALFWLWSWISHELHTSCSLMHTSDMHFIPVLRYDTKYEPSKTIYCCCAKRQSYRCLLLWSTQCICSAVETFGLLQTH